MFFLNIFPGLIISMSVQNSHSRAHFLFEFFVATSSRCTPSRRTARLRNHARRIYHVLSSLRAHRSSRFPCISAQRRSLVHATLLTRTLSAKCKITRITSPQSVCCAIFMRMVTNKVMVQFGSILLCLTCSTRRRILVQQCSCLFRNKLV